MSYLKLDRAAFIALMSVTNLVATLADGLIFYFLPMDLALLFSIAVTGLANIIVTYLSTESGAPPPSNTGTKPIQIVPLGWSRVKSRLFRK